MLRSSAIVAVFQLSSLMSCLLRIDTIAEDAHETAGRAGLKGKSFVALWVKSREIIGQPLARKRSVSVPKNRASALEPLSGNAMRTIGRASTRSRELRLVFPLIPHEMACTSLGDLTHEHERASRLSALRPIQSANREEDVGLGIPIPLCVLHSCMPFGHH